MSKSNNTTNSKTLSIFIILGQRMLSLASSIFNFITAPPDKNIPDTEAGEVMRRYLGHKSWFDDLSSSWVEMPFYLKAVYIASAISISAVIGVFTGSSMLLAFSALVLTFAANLLLVAHEKQRIEGATSFAEEQLELTRILNESQEKLDEATKILSEAVNRVEKKETAVDSEIKSIELGQRRLEKVTEKLSVKVNDVESQTSQLICQQKYVKEKIEEWGEEIKKGTKATVNVTEKVQAVDASVSQFSGTVDDMENSQKEFSKAVSEFSIFVKNTPEAKASMYPGLQKFLEMEDECDEFFANLGWNSSVEI